MANLLIIALIAMTGVCFFGAVEKITELFPKKRDRFVEWAIWGRNGRR